ncbi:MAG TPA: O-antigen ligase family protein, partial [Vicinamibacterales bacterium]|nr:O-antigen ligase family protein [Vicinamibacterales bacterium]
VPLPSKVRLKLSPASAGMDRALWFDAAIDGATKGPDRPLTVDETATAEALVVGLSFVILFWAARSQFAAGGVRFTAKWIAFLGLACAAIALTQSATAPKLIYWTWRPVNGNASPFGPFVNRNDLATWLIIAIPITIGYTTARVQSRRIEAHGPVEVGKIVDATAVWLATSICIMTAALVSSMSRSGLLAGSAAMLTLVALSRRRLPAAGRSWLMAGIAAAIVIGATYANIDALMTRVGETVTLGVGGRREIWGETIPMARDFWLTGVGTGAYARAMSVYQSPHVFSFNHAHDEYLQLLVEGGVLYAVLVGVAIAAAGLAIIRRLRADQTPVFWIRAGAASGLVAVLVQSVWETGLRMPANAVLFAVCAALALHRAALLTRGDPPGPPSPSLAGTPRSPLRSGVLNSQRAIGTARGAPVGV